MPAQGPFDGPVPPPPPDDGGEHYESANDRFQSAMAKIVEMALPMFENMAKQFSKEGNPLGGVHPFSLPPLPDEGPFVGVSEDPNDDEIRRGAAPGHRGKFIRTPQGGYSSVKLAGRWKSFYFFNIQPLTYQGIKLIPKFVMWAVLIFFASRLHWRIN